MYKYVAVALIMVATVKPASALDVGAGGRIGGIGVGAGVSAGSKGASVGLGASIGGVGSTTVGGSVSTNNGSIGVGVDSGANVGNASAGVSTGAGTTAPSPSAGSPAPDSAAMVSANSATQAIDLPSSLGPIKPGRGEAGRVIVGYPFGPLEALHAKPGTPSAVVSACRAAIATAARPLGAVRVYAVGAGPVRQYQTALTAPIQVRIEYAIKGVMQVRQAKIRCRLNAAGRVFAVI